MAIVSQPIGDAQFSETWSDGAVILYADDKPFGMIERGSFLSVDQHGVDMFRRYVAQLPVLESKQTEAQFRDTVARQLEGDGWTVLTEVGAGIGRIDIVAKRGTDVRVIETKMSANANACAHALGQLLFYSRAFESADLYLMTPTQPSEDVIATLALHGVTCRGI